MPGKMIGGYRVIDKPGESGIGTVDVPSASCSARRLHLVPGETGIVVIGRF